jgi:hypothetical protein
VHRHAQFNMFLHVLVSKQTILTLFADL